MRERVHGRADRLRARQAQRQLRLVERSREVRAAAAAADAPAGSRTPKYGVHSAPAYVVGTETSGRPLAPRSPCRGRSRSRRRARGSRRRPRRPRPRPQPGRTAPPSRRRSAAPAARSAASARSPRAAAARPRTSSSRPASSSSPQRTITRRAPRARRRRTPRRRAWATGPEARTSAISRTGSSPSTRAAASVPAASSASIAELRDERDAVAGDDRALDRLLQAELEPDVEVAQPRARAPQLVLDHLTHAGALLHHDQRLLAQLVQRDGAAGEPVARQRREHDPVAEERLEDDAAPPREAPTTPSSSARSATRAITCCVSEIWRSTRTSGWRCWNSHRSSGTTVPPGPVDAPIASVPAIAPSASPRDVRHELLLELEQPLRAVVEAHPRLGRLDPAPGAVEQLLPEPLLERAHLEADGRLRDPEPLRRLREAAPLDDRAERGELLRFHKRSLYVWTGSCDFGGTSVADVSHLRRYDRPRVVARGGPDPGGLRSAARRL